MSVRNRRVGAIYRKDLREYRRNRSVVAGMAILPLIFAINPLVTIFALPASSAGGLRHHHILLYLLGIPALVPAVIAAYAVVGERQLLFGPLLAGWSIWVGMAISTRSSDVRAAQQVGMLASLPSIAVTTLLAYDVIHATLVFALGFGVALLLGNGVGWRFTSARRSVSVSVLRESVSGRQRLVVGVAGG